MTYLQLETSYQSISACYISYIGTRTKSYRQNMYQNAPEGSINFRGTKYNGNLLSSPEIVRRRMNFLAPKIIVLNG